MSQHYSNPKRADEPHLLPDVWVTELTAREVAANDDELIWQYSKRHEFRLAHMNSRVRDAMLDAIVEAEGISGGWCWYYCSPGCMPDSGPYGPFATEQEAIKDMQGAQEWDLDDELAVEETGDVSC